jgi:hypothetical protein
MEATPLVAAAATAQEVAMEAVEVQGATAMGLEVRLGLLTHHPQVLRLGRHQQVLREAAALPAVASALQMLHLQHIIRRHPLMAAAAMAAMLWWLAGSTQTGQGHLQ